jgi:hypothetical protein
MVSVLSYQREDSDGKGCSRRSDTEIEAPRYVPKLNLTAPGWHPYGTYDGVCTDDRDIDLPRYRRRYNEHRPHSSPGYRTPLQAVEAWRGETGREQTNPETSSALSL